MFTILFTAVGRRVELIQAFRESLRKHDITAKVISADFNPGLAPACYFSDAAYQTPKCDAADYLYRLLDVCSKEQVNLVIPLYEPEFMLLDQYREQFNQIGALVLLSAKTVLETCQDKYLTYQFFERYKIKSPQTWLPDQLSPESTLPLFAKPRSGMGSAGIAKIDTWQQLQNIRQNNSGLLVQGYISGVEYTLDILNDFHGKTIAVVPRERLEVRSGEVSKSRTVKRNDLITLGRAIAEALGAIGPITVQCIDTGQDIYWIEINPRFGGGVPLSIQAGADYPYLLYQLCTGQPVEPILGEFKDKLTMLRYDQAVYF